MRGSFRPYVRSIARKGAHDLRRAQRRREWPTAGAANRGAIFGALVVPPIFEDDFESGGVSAWRAVTP